jgi:hypothetical protein
VFCSEGFPSIFDHLDVRPDPVWGGIGYWVCHAGCADHPAIASLGATGCDEVVV